MFQHFGCSYHSVSNVMQVLHPLVSVPLDITSPVTCKASPLQLRKLAFQIEANFFKALICICISLGFVCLSYLRPPQESPCWANEVINRWVTQGSEGEEREKEAIQRISSSYFHFPHSYTMSGKHCFLQSFLQITLHDSSDKNLISVV